MEKTYVNVNSGITQTFTESVFESLGGDASGWRLEREDAVDTTDYSKEDEAKKEAETSKLEQSKSPKIEVVTKKTAEAKQAPKIDGVMTLEDAKAQA